jgi:hypothetical protein
MSKKQPMINGGSQKPEGAPMMSRPMTAGGSKAQNNGGNNSGIGGFSFANQRV